MQSTEAKPALGINPFEENVVLEPRRPRRAVTALNEKQLENLNKLKQKDPDHVLALTLDVTKQEQVDAAVAKTLGRFGRVDVLVNNTGGILRPAEND